MVKYLYKLAASITDMEYYLYREQPGVSMFVQNPSICTDPLNLYRHPRMRGMQAGGSDMVLTAEEVEEGEVDRLVETLITSITRVSASREMVLPCCLILSLSPIYMNSGGTGNKEEKVGS
jgi:hypothetical protein